MKLDRIFLPLGILPLFYISLNRVRMTFARLSTLCNSIAFLSACSAEDHLNPGLLDPLNPPVQLLSKLEIAHLFYLNQLQLFGRCSILINLLQQRWVLTLPPFLKSLHRGPLQPPGKYPCKHRAFLQPELISLSI